SHLRLRRKDLPFPNALRRLHLGVLLLKAVHTQKRRTRNGRSGCLRSRIHRQSVVYICCGIPDAMWQTTAYWLMSAMSNDPSKLAFFAEFYKSTHSVGAAGIWHAGAVPPYMDMFISEWALLVGGLVFALPMVILRIKNHIDLDDETITRMDDKWHICPTEAVTGGC
ncbi:hypothetical protein EDD85DRAFT_13486, partial [Armillaria nabsnona]